MPAAPYLGLVLSDRRSMVSRIGNRGLMLSALEYAIVRQLAANGATPVPPAALSPAWQAAGDTATPAIKTIVDAAKRLRLKLRPFGVTIETKIGRDLQGTIRMIEAEKEKPYVRKLTPASSG